MFDEAELTKRLGDTGKRLHTARSRNDQVALDVRMILRAETKEIIELVKKLEHTIVWAMEMTEKGIYDFDIRFGEADKMIKMVEMIARQEGVGADLSRGVKYASERYFKT